MAVVTPVSTSGNFEESVTGGDTPTASGIGTGGRLSPFAFNTGTGADGIAARFDEPYSVLGAGPNPPGSPVGSATYNTNSPAVEILWGSPDSYNEATFFSGLDGTGTNIGMFSGSDLAVPSGTLFSLVTFTASSGDIGSVVLSNSSFAAFEFVGPDPIPLPPAIYLFGSVLGGAFWLGRRKRSAVSALGA